MAKYRESKSCAFVNPYNFIGINEVKQKTTENEERISGFMDCTMETKTPLAIPDIENKIGKDGEHCSYPFFTIDGKPIVPASSIRGCVRSAYETITSSCFGTLKRNATISRRIGFENGVNIISGVLKRKEAGGWTLYKASRYAIIISGSEYKPFSSSKKYDINKDEYGKYIVVGDDKLRFGDKVFFKHDNRPHGQAWIGCVEDISRSKKNGMIEGVLYIGEPFPARKHAESIFFYEETNYEKDFENEQVEKLLDNLAVEYRNKSINQTLKDGKHSGYNGYERAKNNGVIPVWYRKRGNNIISVSLAAVGRIEYEKDIESLGGYRCSSRKAMCKACALFGLIGNGEDGEGATSRIRFTDAYCNNYTDFLDKEFTTLKELGTPRPGYLQFYSKEGKEYDSYGAKIRGRKYYWHIPKAANDAEVYSSEEKIERNASFQLMKAGAQFDFRIYFDNVTKEQLQELVGLLEIRADDEICRCHHIGHGKPLGLGSIQFLVKNIMEKTTGDGYGIKPLEIKAKEIEKYKNDGDNADYNMAINDFLKITEFDAVKDQMVEYPSVEIGNNAKVIRIKNEQEGMGLAIAENVLANHQWFTENKKQTGNHTPKYLPTISEVADNDTNNRLYKMQISRWETNDRGKYKDFKIPTFKGEGKFINKSFINKDYGVVKLDDGKGNVLVHKDKMSDFSADTNYVGKRVNVEYKNGQRGMRAINCKVIN